MKRPFSFEESKRREDDGPRQRVGTPALRPVRVFASNRSRIARFEDRLRKIDDLVGSMARRVEDRIARAEEGDDAPATRALAADLAVRDIYRLDAATSELRHSTLLTALGNLRILAQRLPRKAEDAEFLDRLGQAFALLDDAQVQVAQYFDYPLEGRARIGEIFPDARRDVEAALDRLTPLRESAAAPKPEAAADLSERIVASVDAALGALEKIQAEIEDRYVCLADLAEDVCDLHRAEAERLGIDLQCRIEAAAGEDPPLSEGLARDLCRVFGDEDALRNALSELARNAIRHAFPEGWDGPRRVIVYAQPEPEDDAVSLIVTDTGCGTDRAKRGAAQRRNGPNGYGMGMVKRVVEREHLGELRVESVPDSGARVRMRFQRRVALPIEEKP